MIVADITEIALVGVFDRGVPNKERIVLVVQDGPLNLGQYGIMLGWAGDTCSAYPLRDNLYWFGDMVLPARTWLFLYTGAGRPTKTTIWNGETGFVLHWGRPDTVMADSNMIPVLFRVDAVAVGETPQNLPQVPKLQPRA